MNFTSHKVSPEAQDLDRRVDRRENNGVEVYCHTGGAGETEILVEGYLASYLEQIGLDVRHFLHAFGEIRTFITDDAPKRFILLLSMNGVTIY